MHIAGMRNIGAIDVPEKVGAQQPLTEIEEALLSALTSEFMSTSVVRTRARLGTQHTSPRLSRSNFSTTRPLSTIASALHELERRGIAQKAEVAGCIRWRRA